MANPLRRIFDQIHHARMVRRIHQLIAVTSAKFADPATPPAYRAVFAAQIGGMLESQADHLAASWLARATTFLGSPAKVREDAAEWSRRSDDLFTEAGR